MGTDPKPPAAFSEPEAQRILARARKLEASDRDAFHG